MKNVLPIFCSLFLLTSCGLLKEDAKPKTTAVVITNEASSITPTSATVSGEVVTDGSPASTERGFTFGTKSNPTIDGPKIPAGKGPGTFTADLTGLTPGTLYHFRAYALNSVGVGYGADQTFTTGAVAPTLTTNAAINITAVSLTSGGTISSDGGAAITARGICWNTTGNPVVSDNKTTDGTGSGSFTSNPANLKSNSKIYIRAYATNGAGTGYGNQVEITTLKAVPANGLIGWWPFNGNANDESGNANNGVVSGAATTTDRFGSSNSAFRFDGLDDFIRASVSALPLGNSSRSFSFYVNYEEVQGSIEPVAVLSYSSAVGIDGGRNDIFVVPGNSIYFNAGEFTVISAADQDIRNTWHHVVIVYDNSSLIDGFKIYFDGVLKAPAVSNLKGITALNTLSSDLFFGKTSERYYPSGFPSGTSYSFKGGIDDIAVFNRALSAEEVTKIFLNSGF